MNEDKKLHGLLIVVSAPSGSGKTSVLFEVLKRRPEFTFSVSATTRIPRKDEKDGINYHFLAEEKFESLRKNGELLEWNMVHGNKYGTLKRSVIEALENGETIILDTDTVGAFNIKKLFPEAVLIFIVPPSPGVLTERLKKRDTESPERMKKRLDSVPAELKKMVEYDYIVINDTFETAVSQIGTIIDAEKLKSSKILPILSKWKDYIHGRNIQ